MKLVITQVAYGRTINMGNYESTRIDLTARVAEDEDWRVVLLALKRELAEIVRKEGA